jgi:cell division septation protein DedD
VQVAATPSRADADRLAKKLEAYGPRIEPTDVPGKGRYWRVRLGAFDTRAEAERFLKSYATRTGSTGLVVASR